ncbi:hypothetical protein GA0061098_1009183 [Bradyrhizobium shewense]|uniref:Uncharacterized protein n=1 Tax=Bradyrhizobium shewense TaxID=1761772 RepID=A0A1C3WS68_9BRAD|nr:hypothetical protein [Bradyrhizobium shewense]SCB42811.1 hypothetical protein GA0061098_1009183 [Bradyrhizobium shewense]
MAIAANEQGDRVFRPEFTRSATAFAFRTICAANIGVMFYLFELAVNDSLFKASAIFVLITYLSMFNYWRRFLGPVAILLLLFALARWLGIDFAAEFARFR